MGRGAGLDPQCNLIRNRSPSAERDAETGGAVLGYPGPDAQISACIISAAGAQVDCLFQHGVIDNKAGDTILDCWANLTDLMSSTDELGGLQFLGCDRYFQTNCCCMPTSCRWLTLWNVTFRMWIRKSSICRTIAGESQSAKGQEQMAAQTGVPQLAR
jgi:hypothetical protein